MTTHAKPARRAALETPYAAEKAASVERVTQAERMPKALPQLLRWYSDQWEMETPDKIHKVEVWYGRDTEDGRPVAKELTGGSKLGSHAWSGGFRTYLEEPTELLDEDGYYRTPLRAALTRLHRKWPMTSTFLFYVAQAGCDWKGVAERVHWAEEPFSIFLEEALRKLWREYAVQKVRLT